MGKRVGVFINEKDITDLAPAISTTSAALVGGSSKGPVEVKLISSGSQFIREYGEPVPGNYFHYSALAYLAFGQQLYCRRVVADDCLYGGVIVNKTGTTPAAVVLTEGITDPTGIPVAYTNAAFAIYGKNPGEWNDSISVKVVANAQDASWFDIQVYETIAGVTRLEETWTVSRVAQKDGFGVQIYLEDRINGFSKYIVVKDNTDLSAATVPAYMSTALALDKGDDGAAVGNSEILLGWEDFENSNEYDVRVLIDGGVANSTVATALITLAESRRDCIALVDVSYASRADVDDMITYKGTLGANTSFASIYGPWLTIYDRYNDKIVEVPASGFVAGAIAYNDRVGQPWTAAAGFNRGVLPVQGVVLKVDDTNAELLRTAKINPIQYIKGVGIVIMGQETLQSKSSALSNMNVRRLIIMIEKTEKLSLQSFLFEGNSIATRLRVTSLMEEYLSILSAQGAFQLEGNNRGFSVVCDESNNTPATIAVGQLIVDVYVTPSIPAQEILVTNVITKSGSSFTELIASGAIG